MKTLSAITKKSQVEIKVLAINTLYEYSKQIAEYEYNHFKQFVGIDVFKVDGSVKLKYKHDRLTFKGQMKDKTWYSADYYLKITSDSLEVHVKICVNGGSYDVKPSTAFCQYEDKIIHILDAKNCVLQDTKIDLDYLDERFNVESLNKIAAEVRKAAEIYEIELKKMPYLFKDVFYLERLSRH